MSVEASTGLQINTRVFPSRQGRARRCAGKPGSRISALLWRVILSSRPLHQTCHSMRRMTGPSRSAIAFPVSGGMRAQPGSERVQYLCHGRACVSFVRHAR